MKLNSAVIVPTAPHFITFDVLADRKISSTESCEEIPAKAVLSL